MPKPTYDPGRATFADVAARIEEVLVVKTFVTFELAEQLTTYAFHDFPTRKGWLDRFATWKALGAGWPPGMLRAWKRELRIQWSAHVDVSGGDWAKYESLYTVFHPSRDAKNFLLHNPMWYVKDLAVEGNIAVITSAQGSPPVGTGKTDTSMLFNQVLAKLKEDHLALGDASDLHQLHLEMQRATRQAGDPESGSPNATRMGLYRAKDVHFLSNIRVLPGSPYESKFTYITKMSDLLRGSAQHNLLGHHTIWDLDEAALFVNKKTPMRRENLYVEQLLTTIRKAGAAGKFVAQNAQRQLPPSVTLGSPLVVEKISPRVADFTIRGFMVAQRMRNIPGTSILFKSRAYANFSPNLDPVKMIADVTQLEQDAHEAHRDWTEEDTWNAIIAWVNENELSERDVELGRGTQIPTQVRMLTGRPGPSGRPYTLTEMVQEIAKDYPMMGPEEIQRIAEDTLRDYAEKRRKRTPGERGRLPKPPELDAET